jgi:fructose-1,6-bisphosphatase/inositol monophosphatase family enzyme
MLRNCLAGGRSILAETRQLITRAFREEFAYRRKADQSWVTEIDVAVERLVRDRLAQHYPGHGVVGEELAEQNRTAEFTWVIDPIDGTANLRHRIPLFGTILALFQHEQPVLGLIDIPLLDKLYSGGKGLGVWCNDRAVPSLDDSATADPCAFADELISLGGRSQFLAAGVPQFFDEMMGSHPYVLPYGDCFGHGLVIEGAFGAMADFDLRVWDVAAAQALVPEAGGKFLCWRQRGENPLEARYDVIFGRPRVVDWLAGRLP